MQHRSRLFFLLALAASCAAGCESVTQLLGGHKPPTQLATGTGPLIDPLDAHSIGYNIQWTTDLGIPADQRLSHIEVLGDVVVCIEAPSNMVTAVSMRDGTMIWRRVVGKVADELFDPVRSGDLLLINSEQLLYVIAIESGKQLEVSRLESLVNHAPAVVDDLAIFGGLNHRVFAHDVKAGYTKWAYQLTERVFTRPTTYDPNVFVADGNGVYAMFVAATGQLLWKGRTFEKVSAQPAISHLGVFVASEDHSLYALHGATGRDRWVYHTTQPLTKSPKVFASVVCLALPDQGLRAIDARTGLDQWRLPFVANPILHFEETLLAHTAASLAVLDIGSGKILIEVPVHPLQVVLPGPDRQLLLVSPKGRLLLMDPNS